MSEYIFEKIANDSNGVNSYINRGEIVRCKDCKHRDKYECNNLTFGDIKCGVPDDWFCADGERKETAEVKHGEWIINENDPERDTQCSICGFVLDDWIQGAFYNFCPHCGADMRKETEDDSVAK